LKKLAQASAEFQSLALGVQHLQLHHSRQKLMQLADPEKNSSQLIQHPTVPFS